MTRESNHSFAHLRVVTRQHIHTKQIDDVLFELDGSNDFDRSINDVCRDLASALKPDGKN